MSRNEPKITPELVAEHGLKPDEYQRILELIGSHGGPCVVLDLFSGTSRVGHALKREGHRVIANDHNAYAATLARCHVAADGSRWAARAERLLAEVVADLSPAEQARLADALPLLERLIEVPELKS